MDPCELQNCPRANRTVMRRAFAMAAEPQFCIPPLHMIQCGESRPSSPLIGAIWLRPHIVTSTIADFVIDSEWVCKGRPAITLASRSSPLGCH
jgi:hypothetical protein